MTQQSVRRSSWKQSWETFPFCNAHFGQIYKNTRWVWPMLYSFYFYCRFPIHYCTSECPAHISIFEVWNRHNALHKDCKVQSSSRGEGMGSASCIIAINEISRHILPYLRTRTFFWFVVCFVSLSKKYVRRLGHLHVHRRILKLGKKSSVVADPWHSGTDRIRIPGSVPVINRSGSCYFHQWPSRRQQKIILVFLLTTYWMYIYIIFLIKKVI